MILKKIKQLCALLLLAGILAGCSDERLAQPIETLFFDPDGDNAEILQLGTIGPVPPEIQAHLFDRFGTREELLDRLVDFDWDDENVNVEFQANWHIRVICDMDRQRSYYQKYIDAGGVAIVGAGTVPDEYFISARQIILQMTAKSPEIRERLRPEHDGFHYALLYRGTAQELPRNHWNSNVRLTWGSAQGTIFAWAPVGHGNFKVVVHEFAHIMMNAIIKSPALDPTFEERLKHAYETATEDGKWRFADGIPAYILTNYKEYWAEGVVCWYYLESQDFSNIRFESHAAFAEYDPGLYTLLSEWLHEDSFGALDD